LQRDDLPKKKIKKIIITIKRIRIRRIRRMKRGSAIQPRQPRGGQRQHEQMRALCSMKREGGKKKGQRRDLHFSQPRAKTKWKKMKKKSTKGNKSFS